MNGCGGNRAVLLRKDENDAWEKVSVSEAGTLEYGLGGCQVLENEITADVVFCRLPHGRKMARYHHYAMYWHDGAVRGERLFQLDGRGFTMDYELFDVSTGDMSGDGGLNLKVSLVSESATIRLLDTEGVNYDDELQECFIGEASAEGLLGAWTLGEQGFTYDAELAEGECQIDESEEE